MRTTNRFLDMLYQFEYEVVEGPGGKRYHEFRFPGRAWARVFEPCSRDMDRCATDAIKLRDSRLDAANLILKTTHDGASTTGIYKQFRWDRSWSILGIFFFIVKLAILSVAGAQIGAAIGITGAVANTVFGSVFSGFVNTLIDGENIQEALFSALLGVPLGGLAYIGKLGLNAAGVPYDILFVESGKTSGTHTEQTVRAATATGEAVTAAATTEIKLGAGFERLDKLGKRKGRGVFVTYSDRGLRNAHRNKWLKVVTVPVFRPPTCADDRQCKVGGLVIVADTEVR